MPGPSESPRPRTGDRTAGLPRCGNLGGAVLAALLLLLPWTPASAQETGPVEIGLLVPSDEAGTAAKHGAEMAVARANEAGGYHGRPFELVVRSAEGAWGSGSGKIVELMFEEDVPAVLGTLDGRTAHLAEQIAVKGRTVLVTPWATDPTLSRARVPWFFRMVPDDRQQARALAHEALEVRGLRRVAAVVTDTSYDSRVAADAFVAAASELSPSPVPRVRFGGDRGGGAPSLDRLEASGVEGVAVFGDAADAAGLARALRRRGTDVALFGPLSLAAGLQGLEPGSPLADMVVVAPGYWRSRPGREFAAAFEEARGGPPRAVAAYAYAGMNAIVEAVRRGGPDSRGVREALSEMDVPSTVVGRVRFDATGNRLLDLELTAARNAPGR